MASAVEVVAASLIACRQMSLVSLDVACEPAGDGPDRSSVQRVKQGGVREKSGDATIPINEWVDPEEAVVRGRRCHDGVD